MKKILRVTLVSGIVFPGIPANVVFVSPKCGATLKGQLDTIMASLESVVKQYYPDTSIIMFFNEDFARTIYTPLLEKMSVVNNDNDLFVRSMKLSCVALSYLKTETSDYAPRKECCTVDIGDRTPRGSNRKTVYDALTGLIADGYMTPELLQNFVAANTQKRTSTCHHSRC